MSDHLEEELSSDYSSEENYEEEQTSSKKKKSRKDYTSASYFLDEEADVDDDESEGEDEYDELNPEERKFIDRSETISSAMEKRRTPLFGELPDDEILEHLQRYEKDYMQDDSIIDVEERTAVSQQSFLPSTRDPKLWTVRCKPGKEKQTVIALMSKFLEKEQDPSERLLIKSALSPGHLKGFIYVEAEREMHVQSAIRGIRNLVEYSVKLVPVKEMPDVLATSKKKIKYLKNGDWVRVRKGGYKGDIASVIKHDQARERVIIKVIPRLNLRGDIPKGTRPPAKFFNVSEIPDTSGINPDSRNGFIVYKNNNFDNDGFLIKDVDIKSLDIENIIPTLEEVEKFQSKGSKEENSEDLSSIASIQPQKIPLAKGDTVRVIEGDLVDLVGTVISVENDHLIIKPKNVDIQQSLKFTSNQLEKIFKAGEHVKVVTGPHEGETGLVISVSDNTISLFSDLTQKEITVQISALQGCSDTESGKVKLGRYSLHDLVQINLQTAGVIVKIEKDIFTILDNNGYPQSISIKEIGPKKNDRNLVAFDIDQNQISLADQVKVIDGPHKGQSANVRHIFKHFLFLHSNGIHEHSGIFVAKAAHTRIAGAKPNFQNMQMKSGMMIPQSPSRTVSSPGPRINSNQTFNTSRSGAGGHFMRSNRDWINKTVKLCQGPFKGYIGMVKNTTDTNARVELHTMLKTITVPINYLVDYQKATISAPSTSSWDEDEIPKTPMHPSESMTPRRTPIHGTAWDPTQTPRTPSHMGEDTPSSSAWSSDRTPNTSNSYGIDDSSTPSFTFTPQQPHTPSFTSENPQTPAFSESNTSWLIPNVRVSITDAFRGGSYAGQTGIIRQVGNENSTIETANEKLSVPNHNLQRVVPSGEKTSVIMIGGESKGQIGEVVAIDNQDGIVKVAETGEITIQNLSLLAIYEP